MPYHKGDHEIAYAHLREAVYRDDNLEYLEPWPWMHPPRHALAALLAEQGHYAEAEQVCRDDLGLSGRIQRCAQHPDNVWALHGLAECLRQRGEVEELAIVRGKLRLRWLLRTCRLRLRACAERQPRPVSRTAVARNA